MSLEDRRRWDAKYAARDVPAQVEPDAWLASCAKGLPVGRALDLASGLGHNAVWLATRGWSVDAIDISPVGLQIAQQLAQRQAQHVGWIAADLEQFELPVSAYDLIAVFRFLDRVRLPAMIEAALKPGGILVYETFTQRHFERFPDSIRRRSFLLEAGELPRLFGSLNTVNYQELDSPQHSVAQLAARKPPI